MNHRRGVDRRQSFFTSLEEMVPQYSFARVIDLLVDALSLDKLGFHHVDLNREGNEPFHPGDLFKLVIYGQRHGLRSASKLAYATGVNTELMWLLNGLQPSARTICCLRTTKTAGINKTLKRVKNMLIGILMLQDWPEYQKRTNLIPVTVRAHRLSLASC